MHVTELAEQPDAAAVVTDRHGDESVVGVAVRHVGHVDMADCLRVQLHHEGHQFSAVVWVDSYGDGIDLPGFLGSVSSPGAVPAAPGALGCRRPVRQPRR